MANSNWSNAGHFYAPQVKPVLLNCSFTVDNTADAGVTGLKGPGISSVLMNKAAAASSPAAGYIVVKLAQNFNRLLGVYSTISAPVVGGGGTALDSGALVQGRAYVIRSLGTSTAANWVTAGLPVGYVPAVGMTFICTAAGAAGVGLGNGTVKLADVSNVLGLELIGNPQAMLAGQAVSGPVGGQLMFQCVKPAVTMNSYTPAGTVASHTHSIPPGTDGPGGTSGGTAPAFTGAAAVLTGSVASAVAAPKNGTIISLSLYLSDSAVIVSGQ